MALYDTAWWAARITHGAYIGGSETAEHYVWRTMLARCHNPTAKNYDYYGARGIVVCERWRKSYAAFLLDMGARPSPQHSIDRRNNAGPYSKKNCHWATRSEQQRNKTNTRRFVHAGKVGTLVEWATTLHISKELAHWRFANWGTFEKGKSWRLQKIG